MGRSIGEVNWGGQLGRSFKEVPSVRHLDVIKAHLAQSEAINDTHSLREAPSLEHLRLRRPQQLSRLFTLIRPLGERGRE